jgi:amino acid transporter
MTRILVIGVLAVTALYLLVNIGYLAVLGHEGLRQSKTVAVDVMRIVAGDKGALIIAVIVCVSVLTTVNAAIFTGARTNYAFGKDVGFLGKMGTWRDSGSTPANAVIIQGAIALLLVGVGSTTPDGFTAMVNYTTPVFWVFMYLTGSTLFVFRERHEETPPFRVPWFPHIPIAFLVTCLYMLYSSTTYALFGTQFGYPALIGLVVMALGVPLYFLSKTK